MSTEIEAIRSAILAGAPGEDLEGLPLPAAFRAAVVRADEQTMFDGDAVARTRTRAQSLHVDDVALPELAPDEAYVAVMASSINFNTVWTSIFEPLPTFQFLKRLGKESVWGARHDQPFHVRRERRVRRRAARRLRGAQVEAGRPRSPCTATTSTTRTRRRTTTR